MITHRIGADTYLDYDWTDSLDVPVEVDEASFVVRDAADEVVADIGTTAINDAYPIQLHIDDAAAVDPGNYSYTLRGRVGTDWTIISAGLLRIK